MKKYIVPLLAVLILFVVVGVATFYNSSAKQERKIALGAWTEGLYDAESKTLHPDKLKDFEKLVDKKFSIAHYYRGWESLVDPILVSEFKALQQNGWTPMINANPYYFSECPATSIPLYKAIASGHCDEFLAKAASNLAKIDKPFYFLFAWEMNNDTHEWSISHTGSTSKDFVAAWRHIHDVFEKQGVKNIIWVFCPNVPNTDKFPYADMYPGAKYVDWVGLDGYNWGETQSWSDWTSFEGVFGGSYKLLTDIAPDKPMMLAEVNTTDKGGNKAEWYTDMFTKQVPYNFPAIQAIIIFNEDRTKQENVNWLVNVTPDSLRAFKKAIHTRFY